MSEIGEGPVAIQGNIVDLDTIAGFWPIRPADISLSTLLRTMDRHGVDRACVVSARGIFFDAGDGNDETLAWCRQESRLVPVGTLDLRVFAGYRAEIKRLAEAGVRLWRLFPEHQDWSFDQARFRRVLSALEAAGAVLFVSGQPSVVARATAGAGIPIILGSHFYELGDLLATLEEGARFYLSARLTHGPGVLEQLVREVGSERLVFGSNAPLSAMGATMARIRNAELTPEQQAGILGGNLLRLLGRT